MKSPVFILTEQRSFDPDIPISVLIQQTVTLWLTNELSK